MNLPRLNWPLWSLGLILSCIFSTSLLAARSIDIHGTPTSHRRITVVVPQSSRLLKFAAQELQQLLSRATGSPVKIATTVPVQGLALILGDNKLSRQAGLEVDKLALEGYYIRRQGNRVYLLGRDSTTNYPQRNSWRQCYQRGTLSAVYDFLERFAGIRFYFPGEMGTIIPPPRQLRLPRTIAIEEAPDFIDRRYYTGTTKWYETPDRYQGVSGVNLNLLRLRTSEVHIPFGHGLLGFEYRQRFAKTHPEYFALMPNGQRHTSPDQTFTGQVCLNSPLRDVIYQDIKAYFTGQSAASRGLSHWNFNSVQPGFASVMTHDWYYHCGCPKCRKIARPGRLYRQWTEQEYQAISNHVWEFTADMGRRLKRDGIKGQITQMSYSPFNRLPEFELPDNLLVQIAVKGPWEKHQRRDDQRIHQWYQKMKKPISLWTYIGKQGDARIPNIPAAIPRAVGRYFQERSKYICGSFLEAETDRFIFGYLHFYIFAKVGWNNATDIEATLNEHYQVMFGPGAPWMKKFYERLEDLWLNKVAGHTVETGLGPVTKMPSTLELWTKIYSPQELKQLQAWVNRADRAANGYPKQQKRIRFMRQQLLQPLLDNSALFAKNQQAIGSWTVNMGDTVHLRANRGDEVLHPTQVKITEDAPNFVFHFNCTEPNMAQIKADCRQNDGQVWADSCVELFLNPSGDRKNYFHLAVNSLGALYDAKRQLNHKAEVAWCSQAQVQVVKNAASWEVTIKIPKKVLSPYPQSGFPVNFARHRALQRDNSDQTFDYQWSPVPGRSFSDLNQFGLLKLQPSRDTNLLKDGDFDCAWQSEYRVGAWSMWRSGGNKKGQFFELDKKIFLTRGQSIHLHNVTGQNMSLGQKVRNLKPDTRYRLSYFIRTAEVQPYGTMGAGAFMYIGKKGQSLPRTKITGTNPWHCVQFEFRTPADLAGKTVNLGLWIWKSAGDAWFDCVKIEEIK